MIDRRKLAIELAKKEMNYTDLANSSAASRQTIAKINRNPATKIRFDVVMRICEVLEIEPEAIMVDEENEK